MQTPEQLFDMAERQEEAGDTSGALQTWRELSKLDSSAAVFLRLAAAAKRVGLIDEARSGFRRAIEADASLTLAYIGLALIAIENDENVEAEELLNAALDHEDSAIAYSLRGVALQSLGKKEQAAKSFERALEIDGAYEEAYFNLGVLLKESNPARAEQLFRQALEHCPDYAEAHRELGFVLSKIGNRADAHPHLRRAVELEPDDARAHVYMANSLWAQGDIDSAISEFQRAAMLTPESAMPLWSLANLYESTEEWDKARQLYIRALEVDPDDVVANMNFGRMLKKKGERGLARRYLLKALSLDPTYDAARHLLLDL